MAMRRLFVLGTLLFALVGLLPVRGQDALNLPSELYVLLNEGVVERYGLGASGVTQVTPDEAFVLDFRVAPDGNWIAYRTQDGLFMADMFSDGSQIAIEDDRAGLPALRGRGETIAWSPDSLVLAYTTDYGGRAHFFDSGTFTDLTTPGLLNLLWSADGRFLAAEAEDNVWWIFQREGDTLNLRAAIPGARGGAWLTPQRFIYPPLEGGLTVLDLNAGNTQIAVRVEGNFWRPATQADGSVVVFQGEEAAARLLRMVIVSDGNASVNEIGTGDVNLTGVRWAPGAFLLTAFEGGVVALVDPISGNGFTLPITSASAYSWGPLYPALAAGIVLPEDATFLAPDLDGVQQVWRLPADGQRARTITPAGLDISEYAVSPDGAQVAYVSNSSLWLHTINSDTAPDERVMLGDSSAVHPAWSADGSTIYYHDVQEAGSGIWRVTADSDPELWLADSDGAVYQQPQPANSSDWVLVTDRDGLALVDASGAVTALGISGTAAWQDGSRLLVSGATANSAGVYLIDADNLAAGLQPILPLVGDLRVLDARLLENGNLRLLVQISTPGTVRVLDIAADGSQPTVIADAGYLFRPRLGADGTTVLGQRMPDGAIIAVNLSDDTRRQLDVQPPITALRW